MANSADAKAAAALSILGDVLVLLELLSPRCLDSMLAGATTELETLRSTTPLTRTPSAKIEALTVKIQALETAISRAKEA
jgi:hypothetical protein